MRQKMRVGTRDLRYTGVQLKTRAAGAGNAERPSNGTPALTQESATVDITPHHTPFVPPSVISATASDGTFQYREVR